MGNMKKFHLSPLFTGALVFSLACGLPAKLMAGGEGFKATYVDTKRSDIGLGKFSSFPFQVSISARAGYDDNVNLTSVNEQESFFTNLAVGVTYKFGSPRTQMNLNGTAGFTYYFDRDDAFGNTADDWDFYFSLGYAVTHRFTPRLTFTANLYATYLSQPDFQAFNAGNFSFSRQSQDFFFTVNKFSLGYAWAPRFQTVTSYTLGYTDYDNPVVSTFQDRFEHTIGNEFRFLVWPTTTLVAEYRYGIVDFTEALANRDSTSHYVLGGIDHSFSPRFNLSARGGAEFRRYDNAVVFPGRAAADGTLTSPYGELTLNYAIAQGTSLTWVNRYSIEQSDVPELLNRHTFRTAASLRHAFTARIIGGLNIAYQNDDYDGNALIPGFNEDSFDISISARYAISRNWALDAGYHYTAVISDQRLFREYNRNRVYLGATFTF